MTRVEAIQVLSQRPMIAPSKSNKQKMFEEAIDMAIEALKGGDADIPKNQSIMQQSPNNGADLISRADAIEAVRQLPNCENGYSDTYDKACIIGILASLPSAVCDDCIWHVCNYNKVDWDALPSAEAVQGGDAEVNETKSPYMQPSRHDDGRTHGEWVRCEGEIKDWEGTTVGYSYWYECDQCGARPPKDTWKNEWHSDYCPSCGARMYKGGAE